MPTERLLLMGGPGTGKTHHIVNVCSWLAEKGKEMWILDLEDKMEAFLSEQGGVPKNMHLSVATSWEDVRETIDKWKTSGGVKQGHWIAVDRMDLSWPMVQRWYTHQKYEEELADRLLRTAKGMKSAAMLIPRFPEGAWQVINESYDYVMTNLLYVFRCNVLLTAGVRAPQDDVSPFEVFSNVGVAPRGQKELPHQPNTVLLLSSATERNHLGRIESRSWNVTTAKDLPGREYMDEETLFDFSIQYLERYVKE